MLEEVKAVVAKRMMSAIELNVKLPVKFKTGLRWGDLIEDDAGISQGLGEVWRHFDN